MARALISRLSVCLSLMLAAWIGVWGVSAADAPPIVLVVDTSSPAVADVYKSVESVVSFMAAYNPISLINTCASSITSEATQDAEVLRERLSSVAECETFDQAQAVQQAVTQLATQPGTIIYIMDGQNVFGDKTITTDPMKAALTELKGQSNCLYVIPIGDATLPSTSSRSINTNAVQSLVNRAGCGESYDAQQPETLAGVLLQAYLDSQHRDLVTNGEQVSLFSRSKAKLRQDITLDEGVEALRVDVVWGEGTLDVILEPPAGATVDPAISSGEGYQSLMINRPPAGDWNVTLSVIQVPNDQVAVVLFSQGNAQAEAFAQPTPSPNVTETTSADSSETASGTAIPVPVLIAGVVALLAVVSAIGVVLWRRRRPTHTSNFFDAPAPSGGTLHSRTTAELPRVDPGFLALNRDDYNQTLPTEPIQKVVITPPAQDEQFRQFPAKVVFITGTQQGQFVPVDSAYFTIGRHSASRLRIQDVSVSREHARIIFDTTQNLYVVENVSQAGTQVNGQMITQPRPLYNGDVIKIGSIQIQFQLRI